MDERSVQAQEKADLALNPMSLAQARERQAELAKLRALMFYAEQKAKRAKKIKSKAYHRVRNRQAKRKAAKEIEV